MKRSARAALVCLALCSTAGICLSAQSAGLRPNQTEGFGANKRLLFTYTQNFGCVDQPGDDQDFDQKKAERDPDEMQIPICQMDIDTTINPKGTIGKASDTTDPLYVLVPMFSVDNDQNPADAISCEDTVPGTLCGPALGAVLIKFFGALPEGFKVKPLVFTQCPDNGGRPGTCTMHASRVDLAPLLAKLGFVDKPPKSNVFVPTPNHSHVLDDDDIRLSAEWWQVRPILVMDKRDWPPRDGSSGITSAEKMDAAEKAGRAIEAPSNFFLFFSSHVMK